MILQFKFGSIILSFLSLIVVNFVHLIDFFESTTRETLIIVYHLHRMGAFGYC